MNRLTLAGVALAVVATTGGTAVARPGTTTPDPVHAALAFAAAARGVPDAVRVDARAELGLDRVDLGTTLDAYFRVGVGVRLTPARLGHELDRLAGFRPAFRTALAELLTAVTAARRLQRQAYAGLSPAELRFAYAVAGRAGADPTAVRPDEALAAAAIIGRIDAAKMLHGAALLHDTLAGAAERLGDTGDQPAPTCLPFGALCVGTEGDDTYAADVQVLVDPGGNDTYLNNAGGVLDRLVFDASGGCVLGGGTTGATQPNLGCVSLPSNICTYDTLNNATGRDDLPVLGLPGHEDPEGPNGGTGSNGSCGNRDRWHWLLRDVEGGVVFDPDGRGVALLADLDGNDTYTVPWSHDDPLFGLVEACFPGEADRVNTNRDVFQGSALGGISLLLDRGHGDDRYRGRLNAQGSGHVGGVALLVAEGRGDDLFWADRLSQGTGIAGGVGILVSTKRGDTTYLLDAPEVYRNEFGPSGRQCAQEGRAGQGEGGFLGVGVLWTAHDGSAVYRAVTQPTEPAYPYAHLLDETGRPLLARGTDAQGSGESFPIVGTPGRVVAGVGLLYDDTDHAGAVCPAAGMLRGSGTSSGVDLSTAGAIDTGCGKFNLPPELDPSHVAAGAVGLRVVR